MTGSMKEAIDEVERRRKIQIKYNIKHNITPLGIQKSIRAKLVEEQEKKDESLKFLLEQTKKEILLPDEKEDVVKRLRREMKLAAENLDFEKAIILRNEIKRIKN